MRVVLKLPAQLGGALGRGRFRHVWNYNAIIALMADSIEAVLSANAYFYRVLSLADTEVMRGIWFVSPDVTCIHPGWEAITGYERIQQSWASIFGNQGPLHVWPGEETVRLESGQAWVTCIENIDLTATEAGCIVQARAVNGFKATPAGWKLIQHRAESIPGAVSPARNARLARN